MARNKSNVYLGYDDEEIIGKHSAQLDSTVNKIGGMAIWPSGDIKVPACPLCATTRPLIVQLYAPLEHSQFHRTLYIFGCLNPTCSQISKSWVCIRTQHLDIPNQTEIIQVVASPNKAKKKKNGKQSAAHKITWCSGADDWGDDANAGLEEMDTEVDDFQQLNEENGNIVSKNDNSPVRLLAAASIGSSLVGSEEEDDDDDESTSMENDLICGFGQLDMHSPQSAGADPNANCPEDAAAASAIDAIATVCAEIEGEETDVVLVETPRKPERDLIALLKHTSSPAVLGPLAKITDVTLKPYFIAVDLETRSQSHNDSAQCSGSISADHIRELYQEYKRQDESALSPNSAVVAAAANNIASANAAEDQESYEKAIPAHGDLIFHQFITTIQQNPGQILRYSRDTLPILIAPLAEPVPKCPNCNGETICEIQILSTLIPKLRLQQTNEPAPIEYGNVLIFTCLKSCWDTPDKMRYERVIVQAEK